MSGRVLVRRIIDIAMTAGITVLMAFQITGQAVHEWTGIVMFALFIAHTILNRAWYRNILKGKYRAVRVLQSVVNLALLVCFIMTAVSGIMMSQYAVPALHADVLVGTSQRMHLAFSHWSFLLISMHLGLHWGMMVRPLQKQKTLWHILSAAAVIAASCGLFFSVRSQIYSYLLFRMEFAFFDYTLSPAAVVLENILMMAGWAFISYELTGILSRENPNHTGRRKKACGMLAAEILITVLLVIILPA